MGNCVSTQGQQKKKTIPNPASAPKPQSLLKNDPSSSEIKLNSPAFASPPIGSDINSKVSNTYLVNPLQVSNKPNNILDSSIYKPSGISPQVQKNDHESNISFKQYFDDKKAEGEIQNRINLHFSSEIPKKQENMPTSSFALPKQNHQIHQIHGIIQQQDNTHAIDNAIQHASGAFNLMTSNIPKPNASPYNSSYKPNFDWAKDIPQEGFNYNVQNVYVPNITIKI